jgi:hypothetical protein
VRPYAYVISVSILVSILVSSIFVNLVVVILFVLAGLARGFLCNPHGSGTLAFFP